MSPVLKITRARTLAQNFWCLIFRMRSHQNRRNLSLSIFAFKQYWSHVALLSWQKNGSTNLRTRFECVSMWCMTWRIYQGYDGIERPHAQREAKSCSRWNCCKLLFCIKTQLVQIAMYVFGIEALQQPFNIVISSDHVSNKLPFVESMSTTEKWL